MCVWGGGGGGKHGGGLTRGLDRRDGGGEGEGRGGGGGVSQRVRGPEKPSIAAYDDCRLSFLKL